MLVLAVWGLNSLAVVAVVFTTCFLGGFEGYKGEKLFVFNLSSNPGNFVKKKVTWST